MSGHPRVTESLPVGLEPTTLETLLRARAMLEHAESHVGLPSATDHMVAIHGLDNAIESLVRFLHSHFAAEESERDQGLRALIKGLSTCLKDEYGYTLKGTDALIQLRKLRNLVQHQNIDPVADIPRFQRAVTNFFRTCSVDLLGCDLDSVSLAYMVKNEDVRVHLCEAERRLKDEAYLPSIVASRDAFENMRRLYLREYPLNWRSLPARVTASKDFPWFAPLFESLSAEVSHLSAGLDIRRQRRFDEYMRLIPSEHRAEKTGHAVLMRAWSREDAEFCYHHAIDSVRRWEEALLVPIQGLGDQRDEYSWERSLGPVELPEYDSPRVYVSATGGEDIYVFEVDEEGKQELEELEEGKKYHHALSRLRNGKLEFERQEEVTLEGLLSTVLTNNPPRWQAVIWLSVTPLSTYVQGLGPDGRMKLNASLNDSHREEISLEPGFDRSVADAIDDFRSSTDRPLGEDDVYQIPGISENQREWILRMWRR